MAAVGLCVLFAAQATGQILKGPEIHVTSAYPAYFQLRPSIAADGAGNFVVVWDSYGQDAPSDSGVFAQRFDASASPLGTEFQVNAYATGAQFGAEVASELAGAFVAVWTSCDSNECAVVGRRFDASGVPGAEFRVSAYSRSQPRRTDVAMDAAGNFVVVWGSIYQIFGQRYDAAGVPQGPEFRVNAYTTVPHEDPSVDMDADGNFVVVWNSRDTTLALRQIHAQRFDSAASPTGGQIDVSALMSDGGSSSPPTRSSVAMTTNGDFVVVWTGLYYSTDYMGVVGQRYHADGTPAGGVFRANSFTTSLQVDPVVASDDAGNFVVTWQSRDQPDDNLFGIFGQAYEADGARAGDEFQVNTYTRFDQLAPAIVSNGPGRFVAAWTSYGQEDAAGGVFAQRLRSDLIFRDGFEAGNLSAWSGSSTNGDNLLVSGGGGMASTARGIFAEVDGTTGIYVQDDTPEDEGRYRARFYLDPTVIDPGEAEGHHRIRTLIVFSEGPDRRVAAVVLRRLGGVYAVMGRARQDDDSQADTEFVTISNDPHVIEIDLVRASGPDASDGRFEIWADGISVSTLYGLDNSLAEVDFARMGLMSLKTGAWGWMYFDEFESRRGSYIGLLP